MSSNLTESRLNVSLDPLTLGNVKSYFMQINNTLNFMVSLTPEQRQGIPKINVANKAFTEDALNVLRNNSQLFPAYMNSDEMKNDLQLFAQLDEILTLSRQLTEKIEDSMMVAGSEAYITGLAIYRMMSGSAASGVPGTKTLYEQLKARFNDQGNKDKAPEENL